MQIGIKKRELKGSNIIITPLEEDVIGLAESGSDIIAFDATNRSRPIEISTLIDLIHKKNCLAMADCSNYDEAVNALQWLSEKEGIIPALEPAHALSFVLKFAAKQNKKHILVLGGSSDIGFEVIKKLIPKIKIAFNINTSQLNTI